MGFSFSERSRMNLEGVRPDLIRVMNRAILITDIDFTILEGLRNLERQKMLLATGASTTLNSRHLTGDAVDIAPWVGGTVSWHWPHYHRLAESVFKAAKIEGVEIEWGGHWKTYPDGPHWQLPWPQKPKPKRRTKKSAEKAD